MSDPKRVTLLKTGAELTSGDRDKTYGPPNINLQCQWELWKIYDEFCRMNTPGHTAAHQAAMQNVFAKIARIACGEVWHEDNYIDGAVYLAIAGEVDQIDEIENRIELVRVQ